MKREKLDSRDIVDKLSDLADSAVDAFEKLGDAVGDSVEISSDRAADIIEKISDRLGDSLLVHKIEVYQARKGLLGGDKNLIRGLSSEVLTEWRATRQSMADGFRKEAQIVREMFGASDNEKDKKEKERHIAIKEANAKGLENDVKIIDEELKERGEVL